MRRWDLGQVTSADVAKELAQALGCQANKILTHMQWCSRNITFYPRIMGLAANLSVPQAIVTINSDIFSEVVVPAYDLTRRFSVVVASWQEGTVNKADLCEIAIERLPGAIEPRNCLLIDNKLENVEEWKQRRGVGLHFQDERSFFNQWEG